VCIGLLAPAGEIIDIDFGNISGPAVPDRSGNANDGAGTKGTVGSETAWSPGAATDGQGNPAVVFDGRRSASRSRTGRAASTSTTFRSSCSSRWTSRSTRTRHISATSSWRRRGAFWFNVREDTSPKYRLRVSGFFNGTARDTFTGTRVVPGDTLTWGRRDL
jgi:hypothetical protein